MAVVAVVVLVLSILVVNVSGGPGGGGGGVDVVGGDSGGGYGGGVCSPRAPAVCAYMFLVCRLLPLSTCARLLCAPLCLDSFYWPCNNVS